MNYWLLTLKPALILVAAIAWWFRRQRFSPCSWLLGMQLSVAVIWEAYASYLAVMHHRNLWWYDLYVPIEFTLLLAYVQGQLARPWQRLAVMPVWLALALAYAADLHANYPQGFVSGAYISGSVVLATAFLALLYDLALRVDRAMYQQPLFWAYLGMTLFFSGMVPLLGLWNQLVGEDPGLAIDLYNANHVLFLLRYGGIIVACAMRVRSPAS